MIAGLLAHRIIESSDLWHTQADLERAKREYFQNDLPKVDPGEENGYLQWFAHNFRDSRTNKTLVEHMWESGRQKMAPRAQEILKAWRDSYPGVFEVMRVEEGMGVEMCSVTAAADESFFVYDKTLSREARVGDWTLSRLEWLDGTYQLVSDGFRVQGSHRPAAPPAGNFLSQFRGGRRINGCAA